MKKFEGILICTDLDGTLLRNDKSISEENIRAIEYFKSEGGRFTFITGRMPYFAQDMYDAIHPNAPIGCSNGGAVYDHSLGRYVWYQEIPMSVLELVKYVFDHVPDMGVHFTMFDKIYFWGENEEMDGFRERTSRPKLIRNFDEMEEANEHMAKIVFCHPDADVAFYSLDLLKKHPRADEFEFIRSETTLFEILPKGVGKGNALLKIADMLGIDRSRTVAIGDYDNDISMIKAAGVGIAVGNALPEVKAVADYVTVSNEEHAIARIIADIESGDLKI